MLKQNIDPLKLSLALFKIMETTESRFSMIDFCMLLLIHQHPESSKADLTELFYGDRSASKSSLDRPINRLIDVGLVEKIEAVGVSTKSGFGRFTYMISKAGEKLLNSCRYEKLPKETKKA